MTILSFSAGILSVNLGIVDKLRIVNKSFRLGHHSTSDNSTAYRSLEEIAQWNAHMPLTRFRQYLESFGLWCENKEQKLISSINKEILRTFKDAEQKSKPHWKNLFTDVYKEIPDHIRYTVQYTNIVIRILSNSQQFQEANESNGEAFRRI